MLLRHFLSLLFAALLLASPVHAANAEEKDPAAELVHLLAYIGVDYPGTVENGRIVNPDEYSEQEEFVQRIPALVAKLPEGEGREELDRLGRQLAQAIREKAPGPEVTKLTEIMQQRIIALTGIATAPRRPPSLAQGQALYATHCVACHGVNGRGDGPAGAGLEPPPSNFHDRERQFVRSLYGLYNTITLGVNGTGMRAYSELSSQERWALAFHVGSLPFSREEIARGKTLYADGRLNDLIPDLATLTRLTPEQIHTHAGDDGVALLAYLRNHPEVLGGGASALNKAQGLLDQSLAAYEAGRYEEAYRIAVSAYLDAFETAEAGLRNLDAKLVNAVERDMSAYRAAIKERAPLTVVKERHAAVSRLLDEGREKIAGTALTPAMTYVSALVILLREGLEALLVLAAIIALLIKAERRDALPWVHLGWASALILGGVTWWFSQYVVAISGASREVTEGVTALLATAILLYVGFWLHSKTHARSWQRFLQEKIHGALQGRTLWALTGIAFLAVYREVFETVLFLEALNQQTATGEGERMLWWGLISGVSLLLLLAWILLKTSLRLPLRLFFNVNAFILFILAIIFTGHGISALQEAGYIDARHLKLPTFDWVGFYPTVQTIAGQLLVIAAIAGLFLWERYRRQRGIG